MFFLYTLLCIAGVIALIFAVPLRWKAGITLSAITIGGLWASLQALSVLLSGIAMPLWETSGGLFGNDTGSMDPLSALFVLMILLGACASVLYSRGYLTHTLTEKSPAHIALHYASLAVMTLAMVGVVTSDGGFSFLFAWELMTIASFVLILYDAERREVRRAALSYLIMMHIGFVLLVVGFSQLATATGSASFTALEGYFTTHAALPLLIIFLAGFGMKAGIFPLHVWLPEAHPAAPSHVSALMSGVMIKTGIYGILRVVAALGAAPSLYTAGLILLTTGIITGLWGIILAATQNDVKRLLAYSSIENIGVILIGVGIAALGKAEGNQLIALCGMIGALLHTLNHSFFKALLFFGAGNLLTQTHTTSLDSLGGVAKQMPLTAVLFLAGTAAICALPPLSGFVSELLIYLGLLDGIVSGTGVLASAIGLAALAAIGGLVLLTFAKLYGIAFLGSPRSHEVAESTEVDNYRIAAMALPLAGILFVGLFPTTAVGLVTRASGFFIPLSPRAADYLLSPTLLATGRVAWLLMIVVGALLWLRRHTLRQRPITSGSTWGCGFTSPGLRMQYTGESFAEGLQSIAAPLASHNNEGAPVDKGEIFPSAHHFAVRHRDRVGRLFSAWWVSTLHAINARVMRLRTGKINHYVLFALAFLALIFLMSIFNLLP